MANKTIENTNKATADFIPQSLNDLTKEFMIMYINKVAPTEKKWFKELVSQKTIIKRKKKGSNDIIEVEQITPFATVRTEFAKKFFPQIIRQKELTLAEMVANW